MLTLPESETQYDLGRIVTPFLSGELLRTPASYDQEVWTESDVTETPDRLIATFTARTLPVKTTVLVTQAARQATQVEVLFFAHGLDVCGPVLKNRPTTFVTERPFKLGELVEASGRPIVLVVPFLDWENLGPNKMAFGNKWHKVAKPENLNGVVAEALEKVPALTGATTAPAVSRLIIAGHSRAFGIFDALARAHADAEMSNGALARLSHVWALDSTYTSPIADWSAWLRSRDDFKVTIIHRYGKYRPKNSETLLPLSTGVHGGQFKALAAKSGGRLSVMPVSSGKVGHCAIPGAYLPDLLQSLSSASANEVAEEEVALDWEDEPDVDPELADDEEEEAVEDEPPEFFAESEEEEDDGELVLEADNEEIDDEEVADEEESDQDETYAEYDISDVGVLESSGLTPELEDAEEDEYVQLLTKDDAARHGGPQHEIEEREDSVLRLGRPDFWPDAVYIVKGTGDRFLNSAREFHKLWGFKHAEFESLEGLIGLIAKAKTPDKRIRVISHAWDGFKISLFKGSPAAFTIAQKQIEALNEGDGALMDELLGKLVDLDKTTDQGIVAWNALLIHLESNSPDALKPFGLTSKTKPAGDLGLLLRRCADLVAVASADPVFKKAVRKSIAGTQKRLQRSTAEVDALAASVTSSGFTFTMSPPTQAMLNRLRAAVGALDDRAFRKTLKDARSKLNGKWLDFRGCRIGNQPKYLEAFAKLMGTDGCTAPDWWSGYPGEAPTRDQQVKSASSFEDLINSSTAAKAAMDLWGARDVTGWSTIAAKDRPKRFFDDFLVAQDGVFPVYEVDYSGPALKEKHTLYWNSGKGKQRWLESMWDRTPKKQAQQVARGWGAKTPRMPTLARHLETKSGSSANPQKIYLVPEPEFLDHIIEVKRP